MISNGGLEQRLLLQPGLPVLPEAARVRAEAEGTRTGSGRRELLADKEIRIGPYTLVGPVRVLCHSQAPERTRPCCQSFGQGSASWP